jgi:hypothetical protein
LELRGDATALAPERLLVFEVRGSIANFAAAIRPVQGLELVDEEELGPDEDKNPVAYLLLPDARALRELLSLWRRWQDHRISYGATPWRHVFELLRELRPWGPEDRVHPADSSILQRDIEGRAANDQVSIEIELVFQSSERRAQEHEEEIRAAILGRGGQIVSRSRLPDIAYHALLVDLLLIFSEI